MEVGLEAEGLEGGRQEDLLEDLVDTVVEAGPGDPGILQGL